MRFKIGDDSLNIAGPYCNMAALRVLNLQDIAESKTECWQFSTIDNKM